MFRVSRVRRKCEFVILMSLLLFSFILLIPTKTLAQQPLEIVSVTPADNSVNVPLRTHPEIVFNQPVNPATLDSSVNRKPIVPFQAVFDSLNTKLTMDLGEMEYQKTYTITIKGSLQDTIGIPMGSDYTFSFTTATGISKRPTSTINVPTGLEPGKTYVITGKATGYIWQKDADNPLELRHWNQYGVDTGDTSMLHPTVLYFPEGYDGYKFYLIYTPYPPDQDENPCLMRSNDGVHFTNAGVTNPLFKYNTQPIYDSQNLADPEAMRVGNTSMIFYEMEQTQYAHIGVALSTDGVNYVPYGGPYDPAKPMLPWPTNGNPILYPSFDTWYEQDTNPNDFNPRLGEPAVIFKDGVFHLWYASYNIGQGSYGGSPLVVHANASDPRGPWTKYGPVDVDGFWGHEDVVYDPERNLYVMIYLSDNPLITLRDGRMNIATSPDPDGPWTNNPDNPVFSAEGGWEGSSLYRSSLVEVGTQWYLYYSANPGNYENLGSPKIGLAIEVPGIRKAEISTNGGFSWTQLTVGPDGGWSFPWTPASRGLYSIQVRVTDDWMVGTPNQTIANVDWSSQLTNPILFIVNSTIGSYGQYTGEILKAEGLNEFQMADITAVNASFMAGFDTIILTAMSLSTSQATLMQDYVSAGGNVIAFKPDNALSTVFGLTPTGTVTSEGYIKVDNTTQVGKGVVGETIQLHGTADNYNLNGASVVATLYSTSSTPTPYPAVATYSYGSGNTIFFAYDLPQTIAYIRQGNPASANVEMDGQPGLRPSDLFVDWVDVDKIAIPQADEHMHLLSNSVMKLSLNKKPLPRLWYFPNLEKTMLIMTADQDFAGLASTYQELEEIQSKGGRASLYLTNWESLTDVRNWAAMGIDVEWHVNHVMSSDYTSMNNDYTDFVNAFESQYGYKLTNIRHHWVVWTGYVDPAKIQESHGIQMDLNYYMWEPWASGGISYGNGWMTGSGLPMRFVDENGTIYNSYQVDTNFADEIQVGLQGLTGSQAAAIAAELFNSSRDGFYSAFAANFHPTTWSGERREFCLQLMDYANAYGVPIWSAKQLLDFANARNRVSFKNITYGNGQLRFVLNLPVDANNLTVLIPFDYLDNSLNSLTLDSVLKTFGTETLRGTKYAWFNVSSAGSYIVQADYGSETTPPEITIISPVNGTVLTPGTTSVNINIATNENADCRYSLTNPSFDYSTEGTDFTYGQGTLQHSFTLSGLQMGQTYHLYYKANDTSGNINSESTNHTFSIGIASTTWWNTSWQFRKPVALTENSGSTLSNYQVNLIVNYVPSKMKSDFSDLRFTDSDQVTPIPYWIESYSASVSSSMWVKVPSIPASGTKSIYMYYGNPGATSESNGAATFEFFDDFNDGSINTNKWVTSGIVQETGGYLQVGSGADSIARQNPTSYPLLSGPHELRSRSLVSKTGDALVYAYIGFADSLLTQFALAPHSYRSYYTYDAATERWTPNSAGLTSYAIYDIVWTASGVSYYQNGVLKATHANPPSVPMGAYLRAWTTAAFARCDWILIHKYASALPSNVVGPEETPAYALTVGTSGHGVTNATGTAIYYQFTNVTVLATPDSGYLLSHWLLNGTNVGSVNPYTLNMTANFNLTAVFTQIQYTLTLNVSPIEGGSVSRNASGPYHYGARVELTAVPNAGWKFSTWSGDLSGTVNPTSILIDGNKTVTANFIQLEYTLTVTISPESSGSVSLNNTGPYHYSDEVQLTAVPAIGWTFFNWTGDLSGSLNPAVITMNGNKTVTAIFTEYTLAVNVSPTDSGSVSRNNTGPYHYGDQVQLTASPNAGWTFSYWSGDLSCSVNPAIITIDGNKTVTATFTQLEYTLTVNVAPVGNGSVSLNNTGPYHYGDKVQLTAVPSLGWSFSAWSGDLTGNTNPDVITIIGNKTVTANFVQLQYTLIVIVSPIEGGSVSRNSSGPYYYGDKAQLEAVPTTGWSFSSWSGDLSGNANPVVITMDGNKTINAVFTQNEYTLTVTVDPTGSGSLSLNNTGPYHYDNMVQLTALPDAGWRFSFWSGDITGTTNPISIFIDGNKTVTANFIQLEYTLTVTISPAEGGSVSRNASGPYHYGDQVQLTANPKVGWTFTSWSGDLTGSVNPTIITTNGNKTVTANFTQLQYSLTVTVSPSGSGYVNLNKTGPYYYGDWVELTALPGAGWSFSLWSGDLSGTTNPTSIYIDSNKTVTATFSQLEYTLTVAVFPIDAGSIIPNSTGPYHYGDKVELAAVPATGWTFSQWGGDLSGSTSPVTIIMDGNKAVTANFIQLEYTLSLAVSPVEGGSVSLNATGPYHYGDNVQLTAVPNLGWSFDSWSGDLSGNTNPAVIAVTSNKSVTAIFTQNEYLLTITVSLPNSGSVNLNNTGPYHYGDQVQLTAVSAVGWTFSSWSGDLSSSISPAVITMNGNKTVTAIFTQLEYTLTVTVSPGIAGSVGLNASGPYYYGDWVKLTASANAGWSFKNWTGDASGTVTSVDVLIDGNKAVTANFIQLEYTLTVTISPANSGSVNLNNSGPYHYGDNVQLTAVPTIGWSFSAWSGDLTGSVNPVVIIMNGNKSVTAHFSQLEYTLAVAISPQSGGSVSLNNTGPYHYGDKVQLTAVPNLGWSFSFWSGDLSGNTNPITITMNGNKTITADFTQNEYTLTMTVTPTGSGSVSRNNTGPYHYGDQVQLTTNPTVGWAFSSWNGDLTGSANPAVITINGNKTVTATFAQFQYTLTVTVSPIEGGSASRNSSGPYYYGDKVQLLASPNLGWKFSGWTVDIVSTSNPVVITIDGNKTVTAHFTQLEYTLTVTVSPDGAGSVGLNASGPYHYGDWVKLTASANAGWSFKNWTGDASGVVSTVDVLIDGNKAVTTNFASQHDIGIQYVNPSRNVVSKGYNVTITVKVVNKGINDETFNVTVYANATIVQTKTITLTRGSFTNTMFTWDTTGFAYSNYTMTAYAIPIANETDTADNTCIGGTVIVTIPGDVDGDLDVDRSDLSELSTSYGSFPSSAKGNPNCNINGDNLTDVFDLFILAKKYGSSVQLESVGYWKLDEGSGSLVYASSGNQDTGTVYGDRRADLLDLGTLNAHWYLTPLSLNFITASEWIRLTIGVTIFLAVYIFTAPIIGAISQSDINNLRTMLSGLGVISKMINIPLILAKEDANLHPPTTIYEWAFTS